MRRRLYFMLPDLPTAQRMMDDLLLARIEARHIHFLARPGIDLGDLPEASVLQKSDIVHGAEMGILIGGVAGMIGGLVMVLFPPEGASLKLVTILITALLGAFFGTWVASMKGSSVPNSRLKSYQNDIEAGRILMIVDVPFDQVQKVCTLVHNRDPQVVTGAPDPTIPAFP